ncbi:MAG: YmdB family metallophosphoesterase [Treponema sp.]|nr:YmdB family metallophosphoesterase [Treponema sp.]
MKLLKIAMIGDVVGEFGLRTLEEKLPVLIKEQNIDFVTVNGENAAAGFGMLPNDFKRIMAAGANVITSGNHIWENREFWPILETEGNMLRPANYPNGSAYIQSVSGAGFACINKEHISYIVLNLQGREFMTAIDCPFQSFDHVLDIHLGRAADNHPLISGDGNSIPNAFPIIIIDFHAESSREKEALAYYVDGRASLIAGTHTHVQTADERILPKGTAYITDLGMTGNTDSVIGMDPKICLERSTKHVLYHMETAQSDKSGQMQGIIAEIDAEIGTAISIRRI